MIRLKTHLQSAASGLQPAIVAERLDAGDGGEFALCGGGQVELEAHPVVEGLGGGYAQALDLRPEAGAKSGLGTWRRHRCLSLSSYLRSAVFRLPPEYRRRLRKMPRSMRGMVKTNWRWGTGFGQAGDLRL